MEYNHKKIEAKWQKKWEELNLHQADDNSKKKKKYILDMFPYPSGAGLHVGHPEGYTATDIYSRYLRMNDYNVLHPMGWDAFGLPAENYAIKNGVHPNESTNKNIDTFRRQIKSLGLSYDWSREVNTSAPDYYKWTQWFFLFLYKQGLAYKKKAKVNWCDSCQTVLANEQVVQGKCERCDNEVTQKDMSQWFFKITDYAEKLLEDSEKIDWPEPIKLMQKNWIGKSEGAELEFKIKNEELKIQVFTTRPDTLFGATYMVLAPELELVEQLKDKIENWNEVEKYIKATKKKSDLQRTDLNKDKSGVELKGIQAINPANKEEIPVFIADYVLASYGTGAIMAVPAHDERDWEFAKLQGLKIRFVNHPKVFSYLKDEDTYQTVEGIHSIEDEKAEAWLTKRLEKEDKPNLDENSKLINSGKFTDLDVMEAKKAITKKVGGELKTQYKLRDWLVSRQRYWGAPIPIIYCDKCGEVPVEEKDLPVELPTDVDFKPTGESPLQTSETFHNVKCPKCGEKARRESDTMDTFVCSSWYYFRYVDAKNEKEFASKKQLKKWMPVDLYVGGAEHAVLHLMYARFFTKALHDAGLIDFNEPFLKLRNQGMILAEDGRKMSKSLGNVINPDEVVENLGADSLRLYEMFMGPLEDAKPWSTDGIKGVRRFLEKVIKLEVTNNKTQNNALLNKTIKKVTDDIENMKFNTAISAMMIFVNEVQKEGISKEDFEKFLIILAPFAPHLVEELWEQLGNKESIFLQSWPKYDKKLIKDDVVQLVIQVNGKMRDSIETSVDISENEAKEKALASEKIKKWTEDKEIIKMIFVKNKLINIVVK